MAASTTRAASSIQLIWIVVRDFEAAIQFYTQGVGLRLVERNDQYGWAELVGPEGARVGIAQHSDRSEVQPGDNAVIAVTVEDLAEAAKAIQQAGGQLVGEVMEVPGHVRLQTFKDLAGNTLQLAQDLSRG
ncbi:MAG: VOC family protein [Chlamydiia bacterium]